MGHRPAVVGSNLSPLPPTHLTRQDRLSFIKIGGFGNFIAIEYEMNRSFCALKHLHTCPKRLVPPPNVNGCHTTRYGERCYATHGNPYQGLDYDGTFALSLSFSSLISL